MSVRNRFSLIGTIVRTPRLRLTSKGTPEAFYVIASNESYRDSTGEKKEVASFIPVVSYGQQAENDAKYLSLGRTVAVEGKIRSWFNKVSGSGGFRFEISDVQYLASSSRKATGKIDEIEDDDVAMFIRQMEGAAASDSTD